MKDKQLQSLLNEIFGAQPGLHVEEVPTETVEKYDLPIKSGIVYQLNVKSNVHKDLTRFVCYIAPHDNESTAAVFATTFLRKKNAESILKALPKSGEICGDSVYYSEFSLNEPAAKFEGLLKAIKTLQKEPRGSFT